MEVYIKLCEKSFVAYSHCRLGQFWIFWARKVPGLRVLKMQSHQVANHTMKNEIKIITIVKIKS